MDIDFRALICFFFVLFIVICYVVVFTTQYKNITAETSRLVVLNTRVALHLPIYAVLIYVSLLAPEAFHAIDIFISIFEAYSFYAFFTLIVTNLGGSFNALELFKSVEHLACCNAICTNDRTKFYNKIRHALFHFLFTRVIIVTAAAIAHYSHTSAGDTLSTILRLVSAAILLYSLVHIILFYEALYNHCTNLFGLVKMFLLKFSVGLIVIQGIIKDFMVQADFDPTQYDDMDYSYEKRIDRGYCSLILLEFVIISFLYLYAHTRVITPSEHVKSFSNNSTNMSKGEFFNEVMSFRDVSGLLEIKENLSQPFNQV